MALIIDYSVVLYVLSEIELKVSIKSEIID